MKELWGIFFEKHAVRREKLGCISSPFPSSFRYVGSRGGSWGERITSAGSTADQEREVFMQD